MPGLLVSGISDEQQPKAMKLHMGIYQYSRLETDQGWTLELGNLEGGLWGEI